MPKYRLRLTSHHSEVVTAKDGQTAKSKVWRQLKKGFHYGYTTWQQFNTKVKAERM